MSLYTVLLMFEDWTTGVEQFEANSPTEAIEQFIINAQSLESYDRKLMLSKIHDRSTKNELLIHVANDLKGLWILSFGADFAESSELSSIYGGYIIQTDSNGPVRKG